MNNLPLPTSDRWFPLDYAKGSALRPSGAIRLRLLRTVDLFSHQVAAARRLLRTAFLESLDLVKALRMRIALLQGQSISR